MKTIGIYLESGPACGGSYQYNRFLLRALADLPNDQYKIIAFIAAPHWQKSVESLGLEGHTILPSRFWQVLAGLWRRSKLPINVWHFIAKRFHPLTRLILKSKCDLTLFPAQDALTYLIPVPCIGVIHDLMHRFEKQFPEVGDEKEFLKREFHYTKLCEYSRAILVDSELGKKQAEDCYPGAKDKCQVLPFITNIDENNLPERDLRAKYLLPHKFLFYPAQFWQHKNHARLLQAIANLSLKHPDIHLVLVGSQKNGYQPVLEQIQKLGLEKNVSILGLLPDDEVPILFKLARALVMPTFFGPTNIPPLEAFALGCPVAVSGIYAMPERYQDAALYFDPNSVEQIQHAIEKLWVDDALCARLVQKGYQIHQQWHYPQFKDKVSQIITQVV